MKGAAILVSLAFVLGYALPPLVGDPVALLAVLSAALTAACLAYWN